MKFKFNKNIHLRQISAGVCAAALLASGQVYAQASGYEITNGISGPGRMTVSVLAAGGATSIEVFPFDLPGGGGFDVLSDYITYAQVGATGVGVQLGRVGTVQYVAQTGTVISTGTFPGTNGTITWNSESRIAPGSQVLEHKMSFSSATAFGATRIISYFDADVNGASNDRLAIIGNRSAPGVPLLTFDDDPVPFGISHQLIPSSVVNATYVGWVTRPYPLILRNITFVGKNEVFSLPGIFDLALITGPDPLFNLSTVFIEDNHSHALALDLDPAATQASMVIQIKAYPRIQVDGVLRDGFEN